MKPIKLTLFLLMIILLLFGMSYGATVITDTQVQEIVVAAQAGGDVAQVARDSMAEVTQGLISQGLTGDELKAQISIGIEELTSGLDAGAANFETVVGEIIRGATEGVIQGVNLAVGEDPNLDSAVLTAVALEAVSDAIGLIVALYPGLNVENLNAIVASVAEEMGLEAPEAYEPAEEAGTLPPLEDDPFSDLTNPSPT